MANRKRVSIKAEHEVLVACLRRCCLCYFLNGDKRARKGQLAHIDHNPKNSDARNLVYLCFDHHDEFDSTTRQSKGLTQREVQTYRDRLTEALCDDKTKPDGRLFTSVIDEDAASGKRHPWLHAWRFPLWLTADQPELFAYSAPAADGVCAIERIDLPNGRIVIACIQVPGNPGNSITNCAEYVCAQVCKRFSLDPRQIVWLENYEFFDRHEWKLVTFAFDFVDGMPQNPAWTTMTADAWIALGLSPKKRLTASGAGELRSKIKKHFPWPPSEPILSLE